MRHGELDSGDCYVRLVLVTAVYFCLYLCCIYVWVVCVCFGNFMFVAVANAMNSVKCFYVIGVL